MQPQNAPLDSLDTLCKGLDDVLKESYLSKLLDTSSGDELDLGEIQAAVDFINSTEGAARADAKAQAAFEAAIAAINAAVESGDPDALLAALKLPAANVTGVVDQCSMEYLALMMDKQSDSDSGKLTLKAVQSAVKEANHMLEEERRADDAVAEINVVLKENNAEVTFALLRKHRRLLEFPPLADVAHKYQAALNVDVVGGRLSQIRIRRSLERVNEEIEEDRMAQACEEEVRNMHRWLVNWFRGDFQNKDTELTTFKTRFHPRFKYVFTNGTSTSLDAFIRMLSNGYGSNPSFAIEVGGFNFRMLDRGTSARGGKGMRVVVGSYLELQKGATQSAEGTNCRIASPVFMVTEKDVGGGSAGVGGRSQSIFTMAAQKVVWQTLHETSCPVAAFPKSDVTD